MDPTGTGALAILITLILPPLYCLTRIYRGVISFLARILVPGVAKMLLPHASTFSDDHSSEIPFNLGQVQTIRLVSELSLDKLRYLFSANVLDAKLDNGACRYPELKQIQSDHLGYRFWREDPDFQIEKHIYEQTLPEGVQTEEKIHECFVNRKFKKSSSPWELVLIRGGSSPLLIFRMHHSLGDGNSIVKLLIGCLAKDRLDFKAPKVFQQTVWDRILRSPYDFYSTMKIFLEQWTKAGSSSLWMPEEKMTAPVHIAFSKQTQWSELRRMAVNMNVRPASLVHSVIGGALGRLRQDFLCPDPDGLPIFMTLSRLSHPEVLVNHFNAALCSLPTDVTTTTPLQRLLTFDEQYDKITRGNLPKFFFLLGEILGSFPNSIREALRPLRRTGALVGISNTPLGGGEGFKIDGRECLDVKASVGSFQSSTGIFIVPHCYKGALCYSVMANSNILKKEETLKLASLINEEIVTLKEEIERFNNKNQYSLLK